MITQQRLDRFRDFLRGEGFRTISNDGESLWVKYEGTTFVLELDEDDEYFIHVYFPYVFKLTDVAQKAHAIRAVHETVRTCKVAKVFVGPDGESVWASAQAYIGSDEAYMPMLERTFGAVMFAARFFVAQMRD